MQFRNCSNFILSSIVLFSLLKYVPYLYDIFAFFSVIMLGTQLVEWLMSITRKYFLYKIVHPRNKAVLITGCDTGFGNALARRMDQIGYKVFAACLIPEGSAAKELVTHCSERLTVLPMDVTDDRSIQKAKEFITHNLGQSDLWAIVNNAGIAQAGEIDWTSFEDLQTVYDVNAAGILRVTKAFLPFIKKSKGRIVNINSVAGRINFPGSVGYGVSKSAAIALTNGLRVELAKWGVKAVSIEPFFYSTHITATKGIQEIIEKTWRNAPEDVREQYGEEYKESFKKNVDRCLNEYCSPNFYEVVDCMEDAITAAEPLPIYSPSRFMYKFLINLIQYLPTNVKDYIDKNEILKGLTPAVLMSKKFHKE